MLVVWVWHYMPQSKSECKSNVPVEGTILIIKWALSFMSMSVVFSLVLTMEGAFQMWNALANL